MIKEPVTSSSLGHKGLITADEAGNISNAFQACQNIVFNKLGFGVRKGYSLVGEHDNTGTTGIKSLYSYRLSDNSEVLLCSHTTWLEWFNETGGTFGEWHTLVASLTSGKRFGFAPFNTTTLSTAVNKLYFCNGVENYSEWNGANTYLTSACLLGATTINVSDTTYFASSGSALLNGTTITYSGKGATTLTGCTNVPAASANDGVTQLPDTTTYSALPKMNFLLTAFSRIWGLGGNGVVQGNRLYYSQAGTSGIAPDPTDFTSATTLAEPGFKDFPEGGARINSLGVQDGKIVVFKDDVINTYTFDYTQANKYDITGNVIQGANVGCGALGATAEAISRIYYVSKQGGLKVLNREEASELQKPLYLTERILPTVKGFDFDNAVIAYDQENNLILVSCASEADVDNDTIICYDVRRDVITLFSGIAASCFATYKKKLYFGHAIEPKVYKLFDGYTDDGTNINASATTEKYHFGIPGQPKALDTFYCDGWIKSGQDLHIRFDFDDNTQSYKEVVLNGDTTKDYIYDIAPNVFGENEFGKYPFGGDPTDFTGLYRFRVLIRFENTKCFNTAVTYWSSGTGEAWFIGNAGFALIKSTQIVKNIISI
jgi:hypothetical protein